MHGRKKNYEINLNQQFHIKVYYSPTNEQLIVLKTILKFTLKWLTTDTTNICSHTTTNLIIH